MIEKHPPIDTLKGIVKRHGGHEPGKDLHYSALCHTPNRTERLASLSGNANGPPVCIGLGEKFS
jgi:hypothetical protein